MRGSSRRRVRGAWAVVAALLVVAVGVSAWWLRPWELLAPPDAAVAEEPVTAAVERTTLTSQVRLNATLSYGDAAPLPTSGGTITALPAAGTTVLVGQHVYEMDGHPVVLFRGARPFWRELSVDADDGEDVRQLQQNLADLGFSPGDVDGRFGWQTRQAVRDWQKSLGLAATGEFSPARVVVADAPGIRIAQRTARLGDAGVSPATFTATTLRATATDLVPETETNGLSLAVARPDVFDAIEATLADGRWFDRATRALPVAVLGAVAAERLGLARAGDRILVGGEWYGVLGVLDSAGLATGIDTAVILGDRWVRAHYTGETVGDVSAIYVRAEPGRIDRVRDVLAGAAAPGSPYVSVTKLSDLAQARSTADDALTALGLVLGGIALLIGGVGIANTMVVSVMERRGEIGLRRALGARPGQIAAQFVAEAGILSLLGGVTGLALGSAAALAIAAVSAQPVVIPVEVVLGGPALAVAVGAVAGLQPAARAARLSPTAALRSI